MPKGGLDQSSTSATEHRPILAAVVTLAGHFLAGTVILWTAVAGAI
jgi:hypothetical protein